MFSAVSKWQKEAGAATVRPWSWWCAPTWRLPTSRLGDKKASDFFSGTPMEQIKEDMPDVASGARAIESSWTKFPGEARKRGFALDGSSFGSSLGYI